MVPKLMLVFFFCLSTQSWAQTSAEDDFKLARNLFRDAGDYATAAGLFAEFVRNYPDSQQIAEARLMLARAYRQSGRCDLAVPAYETFYLEHLEHLNAADARRERAPVWPSKVSTCWPLGHTKRCSVVSAPANSPPKT